MNSAKDKENNDNLTYLKVIAEATSIPFVLLGGPLVGFFFGSFLDRRLNTGKLFLIIFVILGFVAAVKETVLIIQRVQRSTKA